MAHEVIKRVGKRAYRYSVTSYRDPETKKIRSRWTYVGVAPGSEGEAEPAAIRRPPSDTRERLVSAMLELVEDHPYAAITAGMVAAKAGLAHGTFYRYFSDKRAALLAALDRVRESLERELISLETPIGNLEDERARIATWVASRLSKRPAIPACFGHFSRRSRTIRNSNRYA